METTFDRAALLAALEPPRFRDGETEYVGRILSAPEWWRIEARIAAAGPLEGPSIVRLIREVVDEIFPPPPVSRWRWRRPLLPPLSVGALISSMPLPLQVQAFTSFAEALAKIHGTMNPGLWDRPSPTTSGTDSPA
jgi:hypothetical protein